jgi:hypothetical protein
MQHTMRAALLDATNITIVTAVVQHLQLPLLHSSFLEREQAPVICEAARLLLKATTSKATQHVPPVICASHSLPQAAAHAQKGKLRLQRISASYSKYWILVDTSFHVIFNLQG